MKELFEFLKKHKISPNEWFILWAHYEPNSAPHIMLDGLVIPSAAETTRLIAKNLLQEFSAGQGYVLTEQGLEIIAAGSKLFEREKTILSPTEEFITGYRNLFPAGGHGSVPFRTHARDLESRFKWFFKQYPEYADFDLVMRATIAYIAHFNGTYSYMQTAGYFIKKQDKEKLVTSNLATWCELVKEGASQESIPQGLHIAVRG